MGVESGSLFWKLTSVTTAIATVAYGMNYAIGYECPKPKVAVTTGDGDAKIVVDTPPECPYSVDMDGVEADLAAKLDIPVNDEVSLMATQNLPDLNITNGYVPVEFETPQGKILMAVEPNMLIGAIEDNISTPKQKKAKSILPLSISAILTAISLNMSVFKRKRVTYSPRNSNEGSVKPNNDGCFVLDVGSVGFVPGHLDHYLDTSWKQKNKFVGPGYDTLGELIRDVNANSHKVKPNVLEEVHKEFDAVRKWADELESLAKKEKNGGYMTLNGEDARLAQEVLERSKTWVNQSPRNIAYAILAEMVDRKYEEIMKNGLGAQLRRTRQEIFEDGVMRAQERSQVSGFKVFIYGLMRKHKNGSNPKKGDGPMTIDGDTGEIL